MDQNIFFSQQDADHVAGDRARRLMSRMETGAFSLIIFIILVDYHISLIIFIILVDYHKQRIISVYEDTDIH